MAEAISESYSDYFKSLDLREQKRYLDKIRVLTLDPYKIPPEEWVDDVESLPSISFPDIAAYLVFATSYYTNEEFKAFKGLAAYNQAYNGWVKSVKSYRPNHCQLVLLTAQVLHSQRLPAPPLTPWVIAEENGTVQSAHCTCMAGLAETCTHVAALLFYVETAVRLKEKVSVTGVPAYWVPPSSSKTKQVKMKEAASIDFQNSKTQRNVLDNQRSPNAPKPKPTPQQLPMQNRLRYIQKMSEFKRPPTFLSVIPGYQESFVTQSNTKPIPKPLCVHKNKFLFGQPLEDVKAFCLSIDISVSVDQVNNVEQETRGQSNSKLWFRQREGRVTVSEIYNVCHTKLN